jgi:hypothetical protein
MGELIPLLGGALVALSVARIRRGVARRAAFSVGVAAVAVFAAGANGELAESPGYLIVDSLIAGTAAAVVLTVLRLAARRRRRVEEA